MVVEAGSPGIQKQIVKPENLKGMEARYEQTLQELANVIKVPPATRYMLTASCSCIINSMDSSSSVTFNLVTM